MAPSAWYSEYEQLYLQFILCLFYADEFVCLSVVNVLHHPEEKSWAKLKADHGFSNTFMLKKDGSGTEMKFSFDPG